jgi:hypothetical protein
MSRPALPFDRHQRIVPAPAQQSAKDSVIRSQEVPAIRLSADDAALAPHARVHHYNKDASLREETVGSEERV